MQVAMLLFQDYPMYGGKYKTIGPGKMLNQWD